jgi:CPA1 family monovalent cation:H+ antiporter
VFILIGVQLPGVLASLSGRSSTELAGLALVMAAVVIVVRIAWVFPATYLPRRLSARVRARDPYPPPGNVFLVSWAGMRGVVSLAAALALPITLPDGQPFPERDLLVFLTFAVILATLVGQGLSLPLVIRALGIRGDATHRREETQARVYLAEAALEAIDGLERNWPDHRPLVETLRSQYSHRAEHLLPVDAGDEPRDEVERELLEHRQMRLAVIEAEREALIRLHDRGAVSDEVCRAVERDLDLEELRMEA